AGACQWVPVWRVTEAIGRATFGTAWRLAVSPTSTSPSFVKATTDGVVRKPSALAMTVGSPPSRTLTTEFVVPRSIPTARDMCVLLLPPPTVEEHRAKRDAYRDPQADVGPALLARDRSLSSELES